METCAEIPTPVTLKLQVTFPFLSVVVFTSPTVPSTVTPPIPLGPAKAPLKAICTDARSPFKRIKLVLDVTKALRPLLNVTRSASNTNFLSFMACAALAYARSSSIFSRAFSASRWALRSARRLSLLLSCA